MRHSINIQWIFSFFLVLAFSSYSQTNSTNSIHTTVKKYELKPGRHLVSFNTTSGKTIDVNLSVPDIKPNDKVPLIIALHWAGNSAAYKDYSECLAFPALEFMNAIIVAPSDHGLHWVADENESKLIKLIDNMVKHWPIDSSKIIITGYSNGGIGSWYYAKEYPDVFKVAIPMSGLYEVANIEIPVYVIHGKKDELFNVYNVQNTILKSVEKGSQIQLKLLENHSHYMGCAYTEALNTVARQMAKEVLK